MMFIQNGFEKVLIACSLIGLSLAGICVEGGWNHK